MGATGAGFNGSLFALTVEPDSRAPDRYAATPGQGGLGLTGAQERDESKNHHAVSSSELARMAPGFAWAPYWSGAELHPGHMVLLQDGAIDGLARLYAATPLADLRAWAAFHLVDNAAPYLASPFRDAWFGDVERATAYAWSRDRRRLGRPVDRAEWNITPQTVNAYNYAPFSVLVFTAALLQPPAFDPTSAVSSSRSRLTMPR